MFKRLCAVLSVILLCLAMTACDQFDSIKIPEDSLPTSADALVVKESTYYAVGEPESAVTFEYDENGRLVKQTEYNKGEIFQSWDYKYDGDSIQKSESYFYNGASTEPSMIDKYEYDEKGNVTKEASYKMDGSLIIENKSEYEYDNEGNILSKTTTDSAGGEYKEVYQYADDGKVASMTHSHQDGGVMTEDRKEEYEYDENGYLVKEIHYLDGEKRTISTFEYDEYGNVLKEKVTAADGGRSHCTIYEY